MSDSPMTMIYLISGASRGIGLALVASILERDQNSFVYAGTRLGPVTDDNVQTSPLVELKAKYPGRIAIVRCVSADEDGNRALAKEIEARHGRVDTVIANAAIYEIYNSVLETTLDAMERHFQTNVLGPLALFQATSDLLKKSNTPHFVTISSGVGSLQGPAVQQAKIGPTPYGTSKAALNWMTRKIHFENEWIVAFPLNPGPVKTDTLLDGIAKDKTGLMKAFLQHAVEPAQAANDLMEVITNSTRETHGGQFFDKKGGKVQW